MTRKIVNVLLFAFVAVAIVVLVLRSQGPAEAAVPTAPVTGGPASPVTSAAASQQAPRPPVEVRLIAFYFHGTKRCVSCTSIEKLTREALAAETEAGRIEIRSVNVDEPAAAHFVEDFQLTMRTVVLAEESMGTIVRWKRLDACWELFGEPAEFRAYIASSLAAFRQPAGTGP